MTSLKHFLIGSKMISSHGVINPNAHNVIPKQTWFVMEMKLQMQMIDNGTHKELKAMPAQFITL